MNDHQPVDIGGAGGVRRLFCRAASERGGLQVQTARSPVLPQLRGGRGWNGENHNKGYLNGLTVSFRPS